MTIGSPVEVRWTRDLLYFASFLPIKSSEVQWKSTRLASLTSPTFFSFKVTSPDFHWTWTGQAAEFGQVRWIPLEVWQAVRWVRWNWLGLVKVHWKAGGSVKYTIFNNISLIQILENRKEWGKSVNTHSNSKNRECKKVGKMAKAESVMFWILHDQFQFPWDQMVWQMLDRKEQYIVNVGYWETQFAYEGFKGHPEAVEKSEQ